MGLSSDDWHVVSIIVFPLISTFGITASIFISSKKNKTLLAMGIMFSAGVLVSASLIHMLPHSTEVLDEYFAAEDDHSDETAAEHAAHADDDHFAMAEQDGATDDHWDNGRILRRWLEEDHDDHGHEEEEGDSHADHNHAFPWSQTFFSVTFLFLLMIEATLERFIDVHFRGKYGNLFHANDGEEIMYAKGRTATPDKAVRAFQEQEHALHISEQKSQAGTEAERAEVAKKAIEEDMVPDVIKNKCHNDDSSVQFTIMNAMKDMVTTVEDMATTLIMLQQYQKATAT